MLRPPLPLSTALSIATSSRLLVRSSQLPTLRSGISSTPVLKDQAKPPAPPPTPRPRRRNNDQLPILPLVAIFFSGSLLFYTLVKSREGQPSSRSPAVPPKNESFPGDRRKYREA